MTASARLGQLDRALDDAQVSLELAAELFSVADALDANPALRRLFTDYTLPDATRVEMAKALLADKVSAPPLAIVVEAVGLHWRETSSLAAALDRQGVRTVLMLAQLNGELDDVENNLFKLGRSIKSDSELEATLDDQSIPRADRQALLGFLISGKLSETETLLANRALGARARKVGYTLDSYLELAADVRQRAIVKVTAAAPLTADHEARLKAVLMKQLGRPITLQVIIDPAVLGGLSVRVGEDAIEGTVAGRIRLATELMQ